MKRSAVVQARVEPQTRKKAEDVLKKLGMAPNRGTKKTLERSRRGEGIESFESLDEMFESWQEPGERLTVS